MSVHGNEPFQGGIKAMNVLDLISKHGSDIGKATAMVTAVVSIVGFAIQQALQAADAFA
jgi:hypothetical protein